jgi:hypothetical protein
LGDRATLFIQPEAARSECRLTQRLSITLGFRESRRLVEKAVRARKVALASQSVPGRFEQCRKFLLSTV